MENDFRPAILTGIKVIVGVRRLIQSKLVRNNPGRLGAVLVNEIAQVPVVHFDVARAEVAAWA